MRRNFIKQGVVRKVCAFLSKFQEYWIIKYLLIPICSVIPPAILYYIVRSSPVKTDVGTGEDDSTLFYVYGLASEHPILLIVTAGLWLIAWNALVELIKRCGEKEEGVDVEGLMTLLNTLEKIVSFKAKRFGKVAGELNKGAQPNDSMSVFRRITQPDQQVALLVQSVYTFYDAIDRDGVAFRVSLVQMDGADNPQDWYYYYPESDPPRISLQELGAEDSALKYCINKCSIVVIEDLAKEAAKKKDRHYIPNAGDSVVDGSLICYPILHHYTDSKPYVLTIVADKKTYFCNEKKDLYKWTLDHFAVRIGLEHSLSVIKDKVNDEDN